MAQEPEQRSGEQEPEQRSGEHIHPSITENESLCSLQHLNKSSQGEGGDGCL